MATYELWRALLGVPYSTSGRPNFFVVECHSAVSWLLVSGLPVLRVFVEEGKRELIGVGANVGGSGGFEQASSAGVLLLAGAYFFATSSSMWAGTVLLFSLTLQKQGRGGQCHWGRSATTEASCLRHKHARPSPGRSRRRCEFV
jgi:hypothetical protein